MIGTNYVFINKMKYCKKSENIITTGINLEQKLIRSLALLLCKQFVYIFRFSRRNKSHAISNRASFSLDPLLIIFIAKNNCSQIDVS